MFKAMRLELRYIIDYRLCTAGECLPAAITSFLFRADTAVNGKQRTSDAVRFPTRLCRCCVHVGQRITVKVGRVERMTNVRRRSFKPTLTREGG